MSVKSPLYLEGRFDGEGFMCFSNSSAAALCLLFGLDPGRARLDPEGTKPRKF
jgi:hypothetical protein